MELLATLVAVCDAIRNTPRIFGRVLQILYVDVTVALSLVVVSFCNELVR